MGAVELHQGFKANMGLMIVEDVDKHRYSVKDNRRI